MNAPCVAVPPASLGDHGLVGAHGGIVPWFGAGGIVLQGPVPKLIPAGVPPSSPTPATAPAAAVRQKELGSPAAWISSKCSGSVSLAASARAGKPLPPVDHMARSRTFPQRCLIIQNMGRKKKKKAWQRMPHRTHPSLGRRFPAVGSFAGMEAVLLLVLFIYFYFFSPPPRRASEQWGLAVGLGLLVGAYFGLAPGGGWVPAAGAGSLAQRRLWRGFLPRQLGASRVQVASEDTGPAASFGFTFIFPSPGPNPAPAPHAWAVPGFCSAHAGGGEQCFL